MTVELELDEIPADADRFGPLTAHCASIRSYWSEPDSAFRWARSAASDVRYLLGHPGEDAIGTDLRRSGRHLVKVIRQGWEVGYKHMFTCADPSGHCTCQPSCASATVPEGTPHSYPVTAVIFSKG